MSASIVLTMLSTSSCERSPSMCSRKPVSIGGELFLRGPDELRVTVSAGYEEAAIMCCLIESGKKSSDRKDQGVAALTISYSDGDQVKLEITSSALVRVDNVPIQVDSTKLMPFLERLHQEAIHDTGYHEEQ